MYGCTDAKMMVATITDLHASIIGNSKGRKESKIAILNDPWGNR